MFDPNNTITTEGGSHGAEEPSRSAHDEALGALERERAEGTPWRLPRAIPIDRLVECREAFWMRPGDDYHEHHIGELRQALRSRKDLDAITVYVCGQSVYILDGHHRAEAYRREGRTDIPVRPYEGSPVEAATVALRRACKAVLTLTYGDRADVAWRVFLSGRYTQKHIASLANVSLRTVATMSKAARALGHAAHGYRSWWQAQQAWKNGVSEPCSFTDDDWDAYAEEQGKRMAGRLRQAMGPALQKNLKATAHAVGIVLGHKAQTFAREYVETWGAQWESEEDDHGMF